MERTHGAGGREGGPVVRGLFIAGRSGNLGFGLILISLGVVLWLEQQGLITGDFWRHGWPWLIVLLAFIQITTARSASRLGDGVSFALIGVWMLMVESNWHGLTWRNSWPLSLAAIGAGIVVHAIARLFLPESQARIRWDRKEGASDV
jgi:hypothetical protein